MVVVGPHGASADHATFARALCTALRTLVERCHTRAFNVAVYVPPAASASLAAATVPPLPLLARMVDRGALSGPSDIASFEMFGTPVRHTPVLVMGVSSRARVTGRDHNSLITLQFKF